MADKTEKGEPDVALEELEHRVLRKVIYCHLRRAAT